MSPATPLRPTAVAAQPDMGILVHLLGPSRAVPINYSHVQINEAAIDWVGGGQNMPVSPDQLGGVFGQDQMSQMAERMGLSTGDLSAQMSQVLPQAVDHFTPGGQVPEGELGNLGDLLGQLLRR